MTITNRMVAQPVEPWPHMHHVDLVGSRPVRPGHPKHDPAEGAPQTAGYGRRMHGGRAADGGPEPEIRGYLRR